MTDWIGGLPPAAHERIERQRASGTAGSLLSAPAAAALRSAGLVPVGEVFGSLVMNLGWQSGTCGIYGLGLGAAQTGFSRPQQGSLLGGQGGSFGQSGSFGWPGQYGYPKTPVTTSGRGGRYSGFTPYVKAYEEGWQGAVNRMQTEAAMLGAEGVVGIVVERTPLDSQAWEYTAMGTAVRSADGSLVSASAHGTRVWASGLTAEDTAAAILSSMVPRGLVMGLSVSTKHEDFELRNQRTSWLNTEVAGLTEVLNAARHDAREQLTRRASAIGGSDLVIDSQRIREFETACGNEKDFHAEAFFAGTILAPGPMGAFRSRGRPGSRLIDTMLPLSDATTRKNRP